MNDEAQIKPGDLILPGFFSVYDGQFKSLEAFTLVRSGDVNLNVVDATGVVPSSTLCFVIAKYPSELLLPRRKVSSSLGNALASRRWSRLGSGSTLTHDKLDILNPIENRIVRVYASHFVRHNDPRFLNGI